MPSTEPRVEEKDLPALLWFRELMSQCGVEHAKDEWVLPTKELLAKCLKTMGADLREVPLAGLVMYSADILSYRVEGAGVDDRSASISFLEHLIDVTFKIGLGKGRC